MKTSPDCYLGECQLSLGLAHLLSGDLAHLPSGILAHLPFGVLAHLLCEHLAHLPSGVCGHLVHLLCGNLAHLLTGDPQLEDLQVQDLHSQSPTYITLSEVLVYLSWAKKDKN